MDETSHHGTPVPNEDQRVPVLVVEDDALTRDAIMARVEGLHRRAIGAANGREALRLIRSGERPCLILLDLMMQVMNGWQFLEEMLHDAELASIPVVIVSAYLPATHAHKLGVAAVLPKPFEPEELERLVAQHCDTLH